MNDKGKKILHINYSDSKSGAAIAAKRHCEAMIRAGYEARMLVIRKSGHEDYITQATNSSALLFIHKLSVKISSIFVNKILLPKAVFSYPLFSIHLSNHPLVNWADIIYLHWVSGGILNSKEIERLLKTGKIVRWYMHDMNPITGGCHHALGCDKYCAECSNCPQLNSRIHFIDFAKIQFQKRERVFRRYENLEAYTPSGWLGKCVENSGLWKDKPVIVFPNVIDTDVFKPVEKKIARDYFGLGEGKKIILLGAVGWNSPYKGSNYLVEALNYLPSEEYEAIIFGERGSMSSRINIPCKYVGYISDTKSLVMAYNAADVFVSSSVAENFPNVILEAMACGLPCVAFAVGGIPELVMHQKTGYLARPMESRDLAKGIEYVCSMQDEQRFSLGNNVKEFVESVASYDIYNRANL